ncbi:hypothetical protein [Tardiphaga sp. 709]|uniref:hypothetical protein n=1 Tax=Tardiphaga sp. 709 TaxID=3076039 RepID=UPI0028EB797E|nr:hypothetical protein [Tardiphaga sp. 709]WNV10122.1 hypothetical protein RSO67_02680 [Tardiphaga sp. 709]
MADYTSDELLDEQLDSIARALRERPMDSLHLTNDLNGERLRALARDCARHLTDMSNGAAMIMELLEGIPAATLPEQLLRRRALRVHFHLAYADAVLDNECVNISAANLAARYPLRVIEGGR